MVNFVDRTLSDIYVIEDNNNKIILILAKKISWHYII